MPQTIIYFTPPLPEAEGPAMAAMLNATVFKDIQFRRCGVTLGFGPAIWTLMLLRPEQPADSIRGVPAFGFGADADPDFQYRGGLFVVALNAQILIPIPIEQGGAGLVIADGALVKAAIATRDRSQVPAEDIEAGDVVIVTYTRPDRTEFKVTVVKYPGHA